MVFLQLAIATKDAVASALASVLHASSPFFVASQSIRLKAACAVFTARIKSLEWREDARFIHFVLTNRLFALSLPVIIHDSRSLSVTPAFSRLHPIPKFLDSMTATLLDPP